MTNASDSVETKFKSKFKNKTTAAFLAFFGGGLGLYRFYLAGRSDKWGWLHAATLPVSIAIYLTRHDVLAFFTAMPLMLSVLIGFIACLVIGTTSDEKWDAKFNVGCDVKSDSGWPIALLLVLTTAIGAGSVVAVIARSFDLLITGGSYG